MMMYPDDERCLEILKEEQSFPNIIEHCKQVQRVALTIFDALRQPHNVCVQMVFFSSLSLFFLTTFVDDA